MVKESCHRHLKAKFHYVASPIEGPGKKDFGDVDIFVAYPPEGFKTIQDAFDAVHSALGPTHSSRDGGKSLVAHYAIRWPNSLTEFAKRLFEIGNEDKSLDLSELSLSEESEGAMVAAEKEAKEKDEQLVDPRASTFVQVDVQICESARQMTWLLFKHGHGDLWSILGTLIRPYGLTVDDRGLSIRIPGLEDEDKKRSKIYCTNEPGAVLAFLGLDYGNHWEHPFETAEAMFRYAISCKFFSLAQLTPRSEHLLGSDIEPSALKASERRRLKQRPVYRKFMEEFLPECRKRPEHHLEPYTREVVKDMAFATFSAKVQDDFNATLREYSLEKHKRNIMAVIQDQIPPSGDDDVMGTCYRTNLVKAMKRVILDGDERYGVKPEFRVTDDWGYDNVGQVIDFIKENRDRIGEHAMKASHAYYMAHLRARDNEELRKHQEQDQGVTEALERAQEEKPELDKNFS